MPPQWQIRFDRGHQQRYLPDRESVLRYVLSIGPRAPDKRFEVFTESAPVRLADGSPGGRTFSLVEEIDLARAGEAERLQSELAALTRRKNPAPAQPQPGRGHPRAGGPA
jgi:hypothetical protein